MFGRVATILLWCVRLTYALVTHDEHELNLIR